MFFIFPFVVDTQCIVGNGIIVDLKKIALNKLTDIEMYICVCGTSNGHKISWK